MTAPLLVNVVELLRHPGTTKDVDVEVASADLDFADARVTGETVSIRLRLASLTNGITVHGSATVRWSGECRRCLAPVSDDVVVEFDELWQTTLEDPDAWRITGDQIDLLPMVREGILLSIPAGPLCREDCPGFCPACGRDLSLGACGCDLAPRDSRWSALEGLRTDASDGA